MLGRNIGHFLSNKPNEIRESKNKLKINLKKFAQLKYGCRFVPAIKLKTKTNIMKANFLIEEQDLRILFLKTQTTKFSKQGFNNFIKECEDAYSNYFNRNMNNLERYGNPKTYSQWVNGQIIALN